MKNTKRHRRLRQGSPKVWTKVAKALGKRAMKAINEVEEYIDVFSRDSRLLEAILAFGPSISEYQVTESTVLSISREELVKVPAAGVDSSLTKPIRVGHRYYAVVSSSLILYENAESEPVDLVWPDVVEAPDSVDPAYAKTEITLRMFEHELIALREAWLAAERCRGLTVFLDGPIVDPPRPPAVDGLREAYDDYFKQRAEYVAGITQRGGLVIGVVKRVSGSLIVSMLSEALGEEYQFLREGRLGDYSLALYTLLAIRRGLQSLVSANGTYTFVLREFPLSPAHIPAVEYFNEKKLNVYTFLMVPLIPGVGTESKPIRVEVAVPNGEDPTSYVRRAAASIVAWLLPGTNLPKPIVMAHLRCSINSKDAKRMLREIAARSFYEAARRIKGLNPAEVTEIV